MCYVSNIPTESGKIIHMGGEFQREFTHEIPIEKRYRDYGIHSHSDIIQSNTNLIGFLLLFFMVHQKFDRH